MNWAAVSAIISAITLLGVVGGGGAMWGTLAERVRVLTERSESHKSILAEQALKLNRHDVHLGRLEEWKSLSFGMAQSGSDTPES